LTQPDIRPYRLPVWNLLASQPDIELTVFADTPDDAPAPAADEIRFRYVHAPVYHGGRGRFAYKRQPAQLEAVDPDRFDLAILPWAQRYRTLVPALKLAQRRSLPTVVWGHGYSKSENFLRAYLRNRIVRRATGVMLYTHRIARRLIEQQGFRADRTFVAQNAIDQTPIAAAREQWLARPAELQAFRERHGLDPAQTLVFVSRLLGENRVDRLVESAAVLARQRPGLKLVVVGDGPERQPLEDQARRLGLGEQAIFAGQIYSELELAPWLLSSSVFCYPENIGLSLMTAFGFGLPAITSDNLDAQNPEIDALRHEQNGLLYRFGDQTGLTAAIERLLDDTDLRASMSREALRTVTEDFNLPNMVQGFVDATRLVDGETRKVQLPVGG
jgi:glycosyltransferase involved in cell wall biosynthesis